MSSRTRRKIYSRVYKENQIRPDRVIGKGDVLFRGFECLAPLCSAFLIFEDAECKGQFELECRTCGHILRNGESTKFYDYNLQVTDAETQITEVVETGFFSISHGEYVAEAKRYKFCIVCYTLKPVTFFDQHKSRATGRQGECRLCKKSYNRIKNQTRIADQHREAANRRRLFGDVAGSEKIEVGVIRERFNNACFRCGLDLSDSAGNSFNLDHTLPVSYLWPLSTDNATLLCSRCNGAKTNKWPSHFYDDDQLKKLSHLTGIPFDLLAGKPQFNPEALERLQDKENLERMMIQAAPYIHEVYRLRNRILAQNQIDVFADTEINPKHVRSADLLLNNQNASEEEY